MMTDITELAQSLKSAAEHYQSEQGIARYSKTADAKERFLELANPANILALVEALEKAQHRIDELENDEVRQRLANAEHQLYMAELAKHNLKASRKAQFRKRRAAEKRIAELEEAEQKLCAANVTLDARAELAERHLAELESRSITVKLPESFKLAKSSSGLRYYYADEVDAALTAAGIKVEAE
ncbi:ead/Ea22-like family protein [Klebsiella pneumoniae]|uniref:ead/Ea22-like family protein n=1 Tax=Klebsiella pneumoniae TaxID=573 RepID=UPI003748A6EE